MKTKNIFILVTLFLFSGCIFIPAIDSYKKLGLSRVDRERLLHKDVKDFQESLYWRNNNKALQKVKEENIGEVSETLEKYASSEDIKIVESKVENVIFNEDSREATVTTKIRFYKVPFYTVTDRRDVSKWIFTLSDGWKLTKLTIK